MITKPILTNPQRSLFVHLANSKPPSHNLVPSHRRTPKRTQLETQSSSHPAVPSEPPLPETAAHTMPKCAPPHKNLVRTAQKSSHPKQSRQSSFDPPNHLPKRAGLAGPRRRRRLRVGARDPGRDVRDSGISGPKSDDIRSSELLNFGSLVSYFWEG